MNLAKFILQISDSAFSFLRFAICNLQWFVALLLVVSVISKASFAAEPDRLDRKLLDEGWVSLFDGETLFGWQPVGEAKWQVVKGEIRTAGDQPGFLMTTTRWANYQLDGEFKADPKTNSGVFLRTPLDPQNPASDCYEWNIAPQDNPFPTGSIVKRQKIEPAGDTKGSEPGWRRFSLVVHGGTITGGSVDDYGRVDYTDPKPIAIGHIGLQSNSGAVAFRNLRICPLGLDSIFDKAHMDSVKYDRIENSQVEFTKRDELHLTNGPGQVESAADYANFVLQLECKVNGDGLNSGIFFRTLREGRWVGYESQINNRFSDNDRTRPADFGTGGIYRRQRARRVVAKDREWFTKTIVADGPHMAVWVNGYQVSDWTDTRPPKRSAREGLRLEGGAIAIQGHDPTTDFLFRNVRVGELPQ